MLYRTNSQSRLVEEAMRRYQMNYHVVGGFSFYERAEIKDMISYLKVIGNPDDSIALQRVINTPPRGIGKTTMETIERIALETGMSHVGSDQRDRPAETASGPRALSALNSFRELIEDARAMHLGTFRERVEEAAALRRSQRQTLKKTTCSMRWIFRRRCLKKRRFSASCRETAGPSDSGRRSGLRSG